MKDLYTLYRETKRVPGIYCLEIPDKPGWYYIGSSIDLKERFRAHYNTLRKGNHHNPFLQNAYKKYGEQCHASILMTLSDDYLDEEALKYIEQQFIDAHDYENELYNITQNVIEYATDATCKPVVAFNPITLEVMGIYKSGKYASKDSPYSRDVIQFMCLDKHYPYELKIAYRHLDKTDIVNNTVKLSDADIDKFKMLSTRTEASAKRDRYTHYKYYIWDIKSSETPAFYGIAYECAKFIGIDITSNIANAAKQQSVIQNKWYITTYDTLTSQDIDCITIDKYKTLEAINISDGRKRMFDTMNAAVTILTEERGKKVQVGNIYSVLYNKRNYAYGYYWNFVI
jgi:group I intron endonuclease